MTHRSTSSRFTIVHARVPVLFATLGLAACDAQVGEGPVSPGRASNGNQDDDVVPGAAGGSGAGASGTASSTGSAQAAGGNAITPCNQAAQKSQAMLDTYYASCHGPSSSAQGGFKTVTDFNALISEGKVVPKDPEASPLYKRIASKTMPPANVQKRPSDADISAVKDWIACGAPDWSSVQSQANATFVDINSRLGVVLADLRAMPAPIDRTRARYIDLSNLANQGFSNEQIDVYRQAVSFLMNSLSRGRSVVAPEPIDAAKLIYRIDLRDYLWDANSWRLLEQAYPYAVTYDQDSRLFPYDEVSNEQIRRETATEIPIIQGDWLLSHASRPPLYHDLLQLPETRGELEAQLGVNVEEDIRTEQVLRAGFKNAGPSQNHRIIERHELGGNRGALWVSYDFANNLDNRNIFANPLDFQEDGGELIFNLDNGLQAYFVNDAAGRRLDKAPNNVVQDPLSRDGAVENGISCMTCHQEEGQLPKYDEIRDFVLSTGADARETEQVLALYADRDTLSEAFGRDQNRYRTARAALGIDKLDATTMHSLDDTHLGVLDINAVAAVLGIKTAALERALDASPQAFPQEIVSLRTQGGGVQRDAFEAVVDDLIEALGLGRQRLVSAPDFSGNNLGNTSGTPPESGFTDRRRAR